MRTNLVKLNKKRKKIKWKKWVWSRILDIYEEEMLRGKTNEFNEIDFNYLDLFVIFLVITMFVLKMYQLFILYRNRDNNYYTDQFDFISFTSSLDKGVVLCIDLRLSFLVGYYNEKLTFVNLFGNIGKGSQRCYNELVPDKYSYPGCDLDYYVHKYSIKFICVNRNKLKLKTPINYNFKNYNLIFNNNTFSVYSV